MLPSPGEMPDDHTLEPPGPTAAETRRYALEKVATIDDVFDELLDAAAQIADRAGNVGEIDQLRVEFGFRVEFLDGIDEAVKLVEETLPQLQQALKAVRMGQAIERMLAA